MPAWSLAEAEFARRADHPVGDVPVGLARGDREAAGQHRARQRDHDQVADARSCARRRRSRAACRRVRRWPCGPTSTWHQRIVLPCVCGSGRRCSSTRPTTSGPVIVAAASTASSSSPRRDQGRGDLPPGHVARGSVDVLAEPGQRRAHQTSIPNVRAEPHVALDHVAHVLDAVAEHQRALDAHARTRSRCSARGRRRRRRSTAGLTIPQPPHSIQPSRRRSGRMPVAPAADEALAGRSRRSAR